MFVHNFDPIAFKIINLNIYWYSLAYLSGFVFSLFYAKQLLQKSFVKDSDINWLNYNPYRLRKIKLEDLVFEYEVVSIVFEDNVTLNIE